MNEEKKQEEWARVEYRDGNHEEFAVVVLPSARFRDGEADWRPPTGAYSASEQDELAKRVVRAVNRDGEWEALESLARGIEYADTDTKAAEARSHALKHLSKTARAILARIAAGEKESAS